MKKPAVLLACLMLVSFLFLALPTGGDALGSMWTKSPPTAEPFSAVMEFKPLFIITATPYPYYSKTVLPSATTPIPPVDESRDSRTHYLATKTPEPDPTPESAPDPTHEPVPERTRKPSTPAPTHTPEPAQGGPVFTSFGLYWREVLPRVTEEWFMVTPLDLSAQGEQIYPLVASGAVIVGQVRVTIAGGTVRVDCETVEGVRTLSEFLTFFPDLDSVKTISLPLLSRQNYPFRSPVSVASTFGDDRLVLMYINNSVAFDPALPGLSRFDEELYRPWMLDMLNLLD